MTKVSLQQAEQDVQKCYSKISSIELLLKDDTLRPTTIDNYKARLQYWDDELRIALYHYNKASKE